MLAEVLLTAKRLQSTVDHSLIILKKVESKLQLASASAQKDTQSRDTSSTAEPAEVVVNIAIALRSLNHFLLQDDIESEAHEPAVSYSSSEDEFFDAQSSNNGSGGEDGGHRKKHHKIPGAHHRRDSKRISLAHSNEEPDWGDSGEDFDRIYDENHMESELGNLQQQHGSVLMHLLSQVATPHRHLGINHNFSPYRSQ